MPKIYLSPSTQEFNLYINGGNEEEIMNMLADAMEPYLVSSGISFTRNTPEMTAALSIVQSNSGDYDLHLALHSNASPPNLEGSLRGSDVYYNPQNPESQRAAVIIADNLKEIYPNPQDVGALSTSFLGEVINVNAPSVLIEVAYHDNAEDADWIKNNLERIAANIVFSLTEYFGIPFIEPEPVKQGAVSIAWGNADVYEFPNLDSDKVSQLENGQTVNVVGSWGDWFVIENDDGYGYVMSEYVTV